MLLKKIMDEFILFAVIFPGILLLSKMFLKDRITLSYHNIFLIFILSFINIILRHVLMVLKEKYNISSRNFEFMRRMILIMILGSYFLFR